MTDLNELVLTDKCPLEECEGKLEFTHLQNLPVVDCPKLERSQVYMPGMDIPEGLEECPIIKRIREDNGDE